jgi:hypothetical protein
MKRTIRHEDRDYVNPAIFTFTDAARREVDRMRSTFPGKTISIDWGYSVKVHGEDSKVEQQLGDLLIVGLAPPEERSADAAIIVKLDGTEIEIAIPADVTSSEAPVIDTDLRGRLTLRR